MCACVLFATFFERRVRHRILTAGLRSVCADLHTAVSPKSRALSAGEREVNQIWASSRFKMSNAAPSISWHSGITSVYAAFFASNSASKWPPRKLYHKSRCRPARLFHASSPFSTRREIERAYRIWSLALSASRRRAWCTSNGAHGGAPSLVFASRIACTRRSTWTAANVHTAVSTKRRALSAGGRKAIQIPAATLKYLAIQGRVQF